jgi:hypothetical protein
MRVKALRYGLTVLAIGCLLGDPYSYGGVGGDLRNYEVHLWQSLAAAATGGLLLLALAFEVRTTRAWLRNLESALFISINAAYVLRDGFATRFLVGSVSDPRVAYLVAAGVVLRAALIALEVERVRPGAVTPA